MRVNSDMPHTMLDPGWRPIYTALAGRLPLTSRPGGCVPATGCLQRDLADVLGVTVTTVTRGYAEAERRGLVRGEVGRGTYVRPPAFEPLPAAAAGLTDLATNALLPHAHAGELTATLAALVSRTSPEHLFNYQPHGGRVEHQAVAAAWVATLGVPADGSNTILTSGAQHAMAVALATLTAPGDVVLCEAVTYSGMRSLASLARRRARRPDGRRRVDSGCARRRRARNRRPRSVCMPTVQNPTARVMSRKRRQDLVRAATRVNLQIVEDDVYGYLVEQRQPLCALAPERTFYLTSLSKCRPRLTDRRPADAARLDRSRVTGAVFATTVMGTPLDAAAAAAWIDDGTVDRVMAWKRQEVKARQQLARAALGAHVTGSAEPARLAATSAALARRRFRTRSASAGVIVTAGREFAVARHESPNAVRICSGRRRNVNR